MPLLTVEDLTIRLRSGSGNITLVDGLNLSVERGETLGIVGESGSGKSLASLAMMGLIGRGDGLSAEGRVDFDGIELLRLPPRRLRKVRGARIAMIFQDPLTSLNPVQRIESQLVWPMRLHLGIARKEARTRAIELLERVGIPKPEARLLDYPHQFSGGMRQRLMIAIALSCAPDLLIADEPTTALDVTMQAQVLDLLQSLQRDTGMGMIFITHDLGVVANLAGRITVMYAGRTVETGRATEIISHPRMPYTQRLLAAIPRADAPPERLDAIPGTMPDPAARARAGCLFAPRCHLAQPVCQTVKPLLRPVGFAHGAACHLADADDAGEAARV